MEALLFTVINLESRVRLVARSNSVSVIPFSRAVCNCHDLTHLDTSFMAVEIHFC